MNAQQFQHLSPGIIVKQQPKHYPPRFGVVRKRATKYLAPLTINQPYELVYIDFQDGDGNTYTHVVAEDDHETQELLVYLYNDIATFFEEFGRSAGAILLNQDKLPILPEGHQYHNPYFNHVLDSAQLIALAGHSDWLYQTQYSSGKCLWAAPDNSDRTII